MMMFEVFKAVAHIWAWLAAGGIAAVTFLAAAWFLPAFRQTFFALAVGFAMTTFMYGKGTHHERMVCAAKEKRAEEARKKEDARQGAIASQDARRRQSELDALQKKLKEADDAYEKLRAGKSAACALAPHDLR
jgi:hypothetical protein